MNTDAIPPRIFYGWIVVAAAFAILLIGFGDAYAFSAFLEVLQTEFGASRGAVSLVFSLAGFLYFAFGIVSGPLAQRWGARRLVVAGMLLVSLGLALASTARSIGQVYLAYGLGVGLGIGCAYVPVVAVVQRWFDARRGLASGLAVSGIGVGTLVVPPLAAWLIDGLGWRGAYLALAALTAIAGVGMALLIVDDPAERGLRPDGTAAAAGAPPAARSGLGVREAVRSRTFIGHYAACLICSLGVFVPFVHLVPAAIDDGVGPSSAVLLLGAIGVGSTAGRFFLGGIADRWGRSRFLVAMYLGMAGTMAIWLLGSGFPALALFALLFGVFYGGWVAILPALVMDAFGGRNVGTLIGILYTSVALGTLLGPSAAGFIFDATGSYAWPIAIGMASSAAAALIARRFTGIVPAPPAPRTPEPAA